MSSAVTKKICNISALMVVQLIVVGCQRDFMVPWQMYAGESDTINEVVEEKLSQQREELTGQERFEQATDNQYQDDEELDRYTQGLNGTLDRRQAARQLLLDGPVTVSDAMALSLEFNDQIQSSRSEIRAVGGDELIVRSRFLPHLSYILQHEHASRSIVGRQGDTDNLFRFSQTLFEFGKDNPSDVFLRDDQRQALFSYEDTVRDVLSDVRRVFFTILMRKEQLRARQKLLADFERKYESIRQREEEQIDAQGELVTARLNVLNEKSRINALEKEIKRRKFEQLRLMGLEVGSDQFELVGAMERFELGIEQSVHMGLRQSSSIAGARAKLYEQARLARQIWWENAADLRARGGWQDGENQVGMDVVDDDGTYKVSAIAEKHFSRREGAFEDDLDLATDLLDGDEVGWFMEMGLEMPIADGYEQHGKIMRERARLIGARHDLRDAIESVDLDIRQSYQTLLERRDELRYQGETVDLAKQRLEAKQELRQIGRITDNELETFRNQFFDEQDEFFRQQISVIEAQEQLRAAMRFFEPLNNSSGNVVEAGP